MTTPLGLAALALSQRGLRVFPCYRSKRPAIEDNLASASVDEETIRRWWNMVDWSIGVACGPGSNVWVLDLDGVEHEAWLREKEAEHGALPSTVEAVTGKGRHLYFRWPANGAVIRNIQAHEYLPDVRGEGGYTIAPPSVHPSGRRYAWSVDSASAFADAPQWLVDLVAKNRTADGTVAATPPDVMQTLVDEEHSGSHRGAAIARLAGYLLRRYVDPRVVISLCLIFNAARCVEPLEPKEVRAVVNRVARNEARRRGGSSGGEKGGRPRPRC